MDGCNLIFPYHCSFYREESEGRWHALREMPYITTKNQELFQKFYNYYVNYCLNQSTDLYNGEKLDIRTCPKVLYINQMRQI